MKQITWDLKFLLRSEYSTCYVGSTLCLTEEDGLVIPEHVAIKCDFNDILK
jgi:hypothetical protein